VRPSAELIAEGRAAAPTSVPTTAFLRSVGASSEVEHKARCRDAGVVMYHLHIGLSTWDATEDALRTVVAGLAAHGHRADRFGLAFDRAMGVPEDQRHLTVKETGPRVGAGDWVRLAQAAPIQPHTGDYMIGFPAGFQNATRALAAGITTIGNVGQYTAYELLGGSDEILVTEETVRALAAIGAVRHLGGLAHSNLEDGSATQARHFGGYVGWAALELYVVEQLIGARLAHCFGNTIQNPEHRAVVHFALDDLRERDSIGSMIYGNTVDQRAGDRARNVATTVAQISFDIALQLRRPTGHAVNPVPLSEAERIPSPEEIVEVHLLAREMEREVRKAPDLYDWERYERLGSAVAAYARRFRDRALAVFVDDGVDPGAAAQVLLAMRRTSMADLEQRVDLDAPDEVAALEPWKSSNVRRLAERMSGAIPAGASPLAGRRVVLAVLEVHDLVRDALASVLPRAGAEVVLLGAGTPIDGVARAASDEDADAIVLGTYNGNALALGERLTSASREMGWNGGIYMGGILNQDLGDGLPVDARPGLERPVGGRCRARRGPRRAAGVDPVTRVAVVTGASRGLGEACAERLATDGTSIVAVGTDAAALDAIVARLGERGVEALAHPADIRTRDACAGVGAAAVERFGRLDVLVNSAGVYPRRPVLDVSADDWQLSFQTNVLGTYFMMVEAIDVMRRRSHGRIVNVTSVDGFKAHPANAHYAAMKAAVISLTRSLALEVAPLGILVNSVAPGPMATEAARATDWYEPMVAALPTRTPIDPVEVANLVAYLAGPGNVSIAGENVVVSGGAVIV
jgi:NAD(P)-dependent dehydrogenase (short-subunit alcohol dehydrogenase family)/methanogenic corrinoid protein MtbC1